MSELSYKKSGVDIEEGERFVKAIAPIVKRTFRREVMTDIGSFGALFSLDIAKYRKPVLVSGTDGVGTKLKIAFMADKHDTVGIDLVAMCVNDVLTSGAEPLFFLDYFATGKLSTDKAVKVVEGIAHGCEEAGCSLIGGETAEMPGFYPEGEYDLSGFCVGVVEQSRIVDGSSVCDGDVLIGLSSSGIHSNGYSLVRKVFFDRKKLNVSAEIAELGCKLGDELLKPTSIYVKPISLVMNTVNIKGMAHITGGGITGNLPRVLPQDVHAEIALGSWPVHPIFGLIQKWGEVGDDEMRRTFNMGIGYILVVSKEDCDKTLDILKKINYDSYVVGKVKGGHGPLRYR